MWWQSEKYCIANLLNYISTKHYRDRSKYYKVIAKIKEVRFVSEHIVFK